MRLTPGMNFRMNRIRMNNARKMNLAMDMLEAETETRLWIFRLRPGCRSLLCWS